MFVRHLRALKLRKPHRLRSIPQGHDDEDHTEYSDSGRNPEGPLPGPDVLQSGIDIGLGRGRIHRRGDVRRVLGDTCADLSVSAHVHSGVPHDVAAKHGDEESSDRMRGVPDGHLGSELVRWYPVGYQTVARRESASLEHIVDNVKHSEQDDKVIDKLRPVVRPDKVGADHRARSEQDVHERADGQSGDKMPAAVETVGQKAVYQLGHAIHETCDGEDSSERGLGDAIFSGQTRNGERKVLTYKIENRVADHRSDDCAPLPILETFFCSCVIILRNPAYYEIPTKIAFFGQLLNISEKSLHLPPYRTTPAPPSPAPRQQWRVPDRDHVLMNEYYGQADRKEV